MLVTINGFEPPQHLSDAAFPVNDKLPIYKKSGRNPSSSSDRALIFTSIGGCLL